MHIPHRTRNIERHTRRTHRIYFAQNTQIAFVLHESWGWTPLTPNLASRWDVRNPKPLALTSLVSHSEVHALQSMYLSMYQAWRLHDFAAQPGSRASRFEHGRFIQLPCKTPFSKRLGRLLSRNTPTSILVAHTHRACNNMQTRRTHTSSLAHHLHLSCCLINVFQVPLCFSFVIPSFLFSGTRLTFVDLAHSHPPTKKSVQMAVSDLGLSCFHRLVLHMARFCVAWILQ